MSLLLSAVVDLVGMMSNRKRTGESNDVIHVGDTYYVWHQEGAPREDDRRRRRWSTAFVAGSSAVVGAGVCYAVRAYFVSPASAPSAPAPAAVLGACILPFEVALRVAGARCSLEARDAELASFEIPAAFRRPAECDTRCSSLASGGDRAEGVLVGGLGWLVAVRRRGIAYVALASRLGPSVFEDVEAADRDPGAYAAVVRVDP